jgi:hypothetical protein
MAQPAKPFQQGWCSRRSHFHQGIRKQGMTRQVDLLNWRGRSLHR